MSQKAQVLAYDREKRVYKDAHVDNFRKVRHFPSLATIGAGKSDGESIILVQETPRDPLSSTSSSDATTNTNNTTRRLRSSNNNNLEDVPSRLIPLDSLEAMFETTPPLSSFRSAVHLHAAERCGRETRDRTQSHVRAPGIRRPLDRVQTGMRLFAMLVPPLLGDGMPQWSYNNPSQARDAVRSESDVQPPAITANRQYTQQFIRDHVAARQRSHR
ncbi:hypothetical protein FI667_g3854, partial [Globisporangium splendens]